MKSFVEGHGGVVRVTSELNKGSRFTAVLPSAPAVSQALVPPPQMPGGDEDRF